MSKGRLSDELDNECARTSMSLIDSAWVWLLRGRMGILGYIEPGVTQKPRPMSASQLWTAETPLMMTDSPINQSCRLFIGWRKLKQTCSNIPTSLSLISTDQWKIQKWNTYRERVEQALARQ